MGVRPGDVSDGSETGVGGLVPTGPGRVETPDSKLESETVCPPWTSHDPLVCMCVSCLLSFLRMLHELSTCTENFILTERCHEAGARTGSVCITRVRLEPTRLDMCHEWEFGTTRPRGGP